MKLTKFFIMFFILTISFIACKKTTVTVTKPGKNIFEMKDGTYEAKDNGEKLEITNDGNNIKIGDKNYTNKGNIGGFVNIFENSNSSSTGDKKDMLVIQFGGDTITMPATTNGTKALNDAFNYLGGDKASSYLLAATKPENKNEDGTINTKKLLEGVPQEEKEKLEGIFNSLTKNDFGEYKIYKKK